MLRRKKGQSTLEYVLILSAIIAAVLFAAYQFLRPRLQSGLNRATNQMEVQINRISF